MDQNAKKTALRMIPYGLYILTAQNDEGLVAAAGVSWVTQTSFNPTLIVVGVKQDSRIHQLIKEAQTFALNVLAKGQEELAFTFFKPVVREGQTIAGQPFHLGESGAPIFKNLPAFIECELRESVEIGDHSVFVGEVVNAGLNRPIEGRPDETTLWVKDLGDRIFYGG
jgi:flavin reductase (DIM6/NTAB) family NADH-FMN oxidoreductase RutF